MDNNDYTQQAVSLFNKHAESYSTKFSDVSMYSKGLDLFEYELRFENGRVLDVACGPGNCMRYLLDRNPNLSFLGTELAPDMIRIAKEINPTADFRLLDSKAIKQLDDKFDGILISFCLPYLNGVEAEQIIADSYDLLNSDGVLYISTMEDPPGKSGFEKASSGESLYMNYHSGEVLLKRMEEVGFQNLLVDRISYESGPEKQVTDFIVVAKKL